jgi:hypothetical protein
VPKHGASKHRNSLFLIGFGGLEIRNPEGEEALHDSRIKNQRRLNAGVSWEGGKPRSGSLPSLFWFRALRGRFCRFYRGVVPRKNPRSEQHRQEQTEGRAYIEARLERSGIKTGIHGG